MNNTNTGGPAFPAGIKVPNGDGTEMAIYHHGMTMRDYFAAKAMERVDWYLVDYGGNTSETLDRRMSAEQAAWCYAVADAMLKAREQ